MLIKARYVVPVDQPPIEHGAVAIHEDTIHGVDREKHLRGEPVIDYGDAVILPGFVNAHTHLELTLLTDLVPPGGRLPDWLLSLVRHLRDNPPTRETVAQAVRTGVRQSLASGVTMVGDITGCPNWSRPILASEPIRSVSFGEVIAIGTQRERLAERLAAATSTRHQSDRMRIGVSPHAPYTIEPPALAECVRSAAPASLPMCMHLAESAEEERFTRTHTGPLARYLRDLGVWDDRIPCAGVGPIEFAEQAGLLGPKTLLAHANYVTDEDIDTIARSGASVAYCPRTHQAFGHAPHRYREMSKAGVNVCVATDSLASNPSLSVLDELRFLKRLHPDCSSHGLIAMGTLAGAQALVAEHHTGSITSGKAADLVVLPLDPGEAWETILTSDRQPTEVFVGGIAMMKKLTAR